MQVNVRLHVAVEVHGHEGGELQEAGIDAPHGTAIAEGHGGDQVALEPRDRVARRELVHFCRIDPRVDGPGHQRHAARLGPMTPLSHDGDGGEHGDAGLAHRDDVGLGSHRLEEPDDVGDVVVEPEPPGGERHVARIVPVGQVHVVIREHGADGGAQERREVARHGRDQEHARLVARNVLPEAQQGPEGRPVHDVLAHGNVAPVHADAIDAVRRALVGETGPRDHLEARRRAVEPRQRPPAHQNDWRIMDAVRPAIVRTGAMTSV